MLASFFFVALYMQNILGYSPLEAGVRMLPTTLLIIVLGPIIGRLTDRIGAAPADDRAPAVAVSLFWQSRIDVDTGYGFLVGSFVARARDRLRHVPDEHRGDELGGAPEGRRGLRRGCRCRAWSAGRSASPSIGALVTTVGRDKLDALLPGTPAAARDSLAQGLGAGVVPGNASREVAAAVREAFVSSLSIGLTVGTVVVLASAALAWALVGRDAPPRRRRLPRPHRPSRCRSRKPLDKLRGHGRHRSHRPVLRNRLPQGGPRRCARADRRDLPALRRERAGTSTSRRTTSTGSRSSSTSSASPSGRPTGTARSSRACVPACSGWYQVPLLYNWYDIVGDGSLKNGNGVHAEAQASA